MNAKKEFLTHIPRIKVKCATIIFGDNRWQEEEIPVNPIILPCAWNIDEYNEFLSKIDREYDNGYGGQELFGTIWYEDGTWSDRYEYDGSESWQYNIVPKIPENMKRLDIVRNNKISDIL